MINNDRIIYFDVLRIIAVFAVIMLHVAAQQFYSAFPSDNWTYFNIYDSLCRWGVPVFVMISGALFLNPLKRFSVKTLYQKNIVRILLALIFWSVLYQLYIYRHNESFNLFSFISETIIGPVHLWFLKMLLGLYIALPILRTVVSDKRIELYFIIVAVVTSFIVPLIPRIIGLYNSDVAVIINNQISTVNLNIALGYTGYFVLGHYLNTYQLTKRYRSFIYVCGVISLISVPLLTQIISNSVNRPISDLYSNLMPFTLFEAITIFLFVKNNCNNGVPHVKNEVIADFSKTTFGIYLIHMLLIWIARSTFGITSSTYHPAIFVPLFSFIIFIISFVAIKIMMNVPILKKFVS